MSINQGVQSVVQLGENVLQKAEGAYTYSKDTTLALLNQTKEKALQTRKNYNEFRENFEKAIYNIVQESINEVLLRGERLVGVPKNKKTAETIECSRQRL